MPSLAIIGVWNNPIQGAKIRKNLESNITNHQNKSQNKRLLYTCNRNFFNFQYNYKCSICRKFVSLRKLNQVKKRLSFESWTKEKNLMYRKLLKTEEKKQKKSKDIECKKASQEVSILLQKIINY